MPSASLPIEERVRQFQAVRNATALRHFHYVVSGAAVLISISGVILFASVVVRLRAHEAAGTAAVDFWLKTNKDACSSHMLDVDQDGITAMVSDEG